jgi:hypothetical protein
MKIVNGNLVLEQVTCWDCDGKKEVTRFDLCPHNYKQVRQFGGKCPHCGAKNKYSHKTVGQHQEPCHTCEAKGVRTETPYDIIKTDDWKAIVPQFRFKVVRGNRRADFNESYLGIGILWGVTDYIDWTQKTDAEAIAAATKIESMGNKPAQAVGLVKKDTLDVCLDLAIILLRDGWHVIRYIPINGPNCPLT